MHASPNRNSQRGYTLMEILVAVAIFATVMIVALLLYDQSNRVFKQSNESAEMQQNTRVAFEKVAADLRMAGFDYKRGGSGSANAPSAWAPNRDYAQGTLIIPKVPNGHIYRATKTGKSGADPGPTFPTGSGAKVSDGTTEWEEYGIGSSEQPDEQIEFAHDRAITIRANFDYEDPNTPDNGREDVLEGKSKGHFPVITTGNDEIVTYALVSRSGDPNANKDTITFYADVTDGSAALRDSYPGGSVEDKIEITGVDLTNKYPPYTLMRYTLDDKGKPIATALADNIRSMTFSYWEDATARIPLRDFVGTKITDFATLGGIGQYDPSKPTLLVKERLIRGKVRAVTATIVGMSPQPDRNYTHPSETNTLATNYRQYSLQTTIVGRNLGLKGMPQSETNPPPAPIMGTACTGWCGVVNLNWSPGPGTGEVTYTVLYDTSLSGSFSGVLPAGTQTSYAVDLTQFDMSKTYYFRVAATNAAGTTVSAGSPLAIDVKNATKPKPPAVDSVTTDQPNQITLTFTPLKEFASGTLTGSCPPGSPAFPAEAKGYRILRSLTSGFDVNDPSKYVEVANESSTDITNVGTGALQFVDTDIANCETYYYRIATVEWCSAKAEYNAAGDVAGAISNYSAEVPGKSVATAPPKAPTNFKQSVDSVCDDAMNSCSPVTLLWDKVVKDTAGKDIIVNQYTVRRQRKKAGANDSTNDLVGTVTSGATTITDATPLQAFDSSTGARYTYEYTVVAEQPKCDSAYTTSAAATLLYPGTCVTGATIAAEADGPGSGTLDDPMQNVTSLTLVPHASKPVKSVDVAIDGPPFQTLTTTPYSIDWDIQDGEIHRVQFRVQTEDCTEMLSFYVEANTADCAVVASASNVIGQPNQVQLVLTNTSGEAIVMSEIAITWAGQFGYTWDTVKFPNAVTPAPATPQAGQTTADPRTVVFTPTGQDKNIDAGATYKMILNFTGLTTIRPATVTGVNVEYKQGKATTQFGCSPAVPACSVTATSKLGADGKTIEVEIANSSGEPLTVTKFTIRWAGQAEWVWGGVTAGATIDINPDVAGPVTRTFPSSGVLSGFVIQPNDKGTIVMNMVPTKPNPDALLGTTVGDVLLEYTTPTSGTVSALTCRAK